MPREIIDHKVNGCNDAISIYATDEPGSGGANHRYEIGGIDFSRNASQPDGEIFKDVKPGDIMVLLFQNGPIPANGTNGLTQEALLAIVADRLRSFQAGPFSNKDNAIALTHIEAAILWLQKRTNDRMRRGVEGTLQK